MHIEAGLDPPAREQCHQVNYVLRGIRRAQSTTPRRTRLPLTADVMRAIQVAVFSPARECSELERHLLWAACCLGFFGFLRSGEFTVKDPRHEAPLLASDMAVDSHSHPATIGHSFRIGAASTAAARGVPDHLIKTLGQLRSEAYQLYVRTPPSTLAAMSFRLVVGGQGHMLP